MSKPFIPQKLQKHIKLFLKVSLSLVALWYVISNIENPHELWGTIASSNAWILIAALLVYVVSQVISAYRLNELLRCLPVRISQTSNLKLYWLGLFYNLFLPGGVGGDGYKVYLLNKHHRLSVRKLIGTILSDRISGLSVILVYLLALVYFINYSVPYQGWFWILIPTVSFGFYLFLRLFNPDLVKAFWPVSGFSLLVQGLQMLAAILILEAMGARVVGHRDDFLFLFLLSAITASIPITLGGIGARELTLLKGAELLGLNQNHAVALSLLFYAISLIVAIPGFIYTLKPEKIVALPQTIESEDSDSNYLTA
jgi:hypothetical protein